MDKFKLGIVSCGFLGCSPVAPGTAGTLGGVLIAWLLRGSDLYLAWTLVVCTALYAVGRSLGAWCERYSGEHDPGFFVLDEVIGYLLTVAWVAGPSLIALATGFFVFRAYDIFKPPPARRMEAIPGGDGILLDDVVAGLWGLATMTLLRFLVLGPDRWVS